MNDTEWLKRFGVSINEVLRYGYAGFLCLVIGGLVADDETHDLVENLGTVLTAIAAVAVGAALYAASRNSFGFLIEFIQEHIHRWTWAWLTGIPTKRERLRKLGVFYWNEVAAFRLVRDSELWPEDLQNRFHRQHSEIHLIHLSTFVLLLAGIATRVAIPDESRHGLLFWMAGVFFLIGILADISLSRNESLQFTQLDSDNVKQFLKDGRLIPETQTEPHPGREIGTE